MGLTIYMLGLVVDDMTKSLAFYRDLGVEIPEGAEGLSHVQIKMPGDWVFFLDSNPERWDVQFERPAPEAGPGYRSLIEFYLGSEAAVRAKYSAMTALGYEGLRAPYLTLSNMCFAFLRDPAGNAVLISGDSA